MYGGTIEIRIIETEMSVRKAASKTRQLAILMEVIVNMEIKGTKRRIMLRGKLFSEAITPMALKEKRIHISVKVVITIFVSFFYSSQVY